jgi:lipid-A-disaccharide synthase-like uncharacterized protein
MQDSIAMENVIIWDLIGYLAALLFLPPLLKGSRPSFKWFSLTGSLLFIVYGYTIKAYPVCVANVFVASISMIQLYRLKFEEESFKILKVNIDSEYLQLFLEHHSKDIFHYFPNFKFKPEKYVHCFYILRDMNIAGLYITSKHDDFSLNLELDFVIPGYRDFRTGTWLYEKYKSVFVDEGFKKIISPCFNRSHEKYLKKMGFELRMIDEKRQFVKSFM